MGGGKIPQFSYISTGTIAADDILCIGNENMLDAFTADDVFEIAELEKKNDAGDSITLLLDREFPNQKVELLILSSKTARKVKSNPLTVVKLDKTWNFLESNGKKLYDTMLENEQFKKGVIEAKKLIETKNKPLRTGLFSFGIIVAATLLYLILSSLFLGQASKTVPEEYKNKLIEVQLLIEKANKDLGNKENFNAQIKKAEGILFEVRDKQVFLNDVKKLLGDISILKKQMNGVESFDPKSHTPEYTFQDKTFNVLAVFDIGKKLYFVGKNGLIGPYVKGSEVKTYAYPDGEEAIATDSSADGDIFIFTKTNRLLKFYKGELSYVNVEGQKMWEVGRAIKTFNSNLYLLSGDGKQLYKHKPGVSGFSSKSEVIQSADLKNHSIVEFGVDGGFYLLKEDLTLDKVFGMPNYSRRSIVINNLPDNYSIESADNPPKFYTAQNLNYLYLLLNNRIWIFEPDNKNYKDVKSIRYVGQIEFVEGKIGALNIPKDGTVVVASDSGVFTLGFEVSDGKVIVR